MKLVSGGTDLLFEQYGIKQIHEIEQSIRADIEKKKEDLRQMVGERYRDLIEAADTIGQMQQTSANVKQYVAQLTDQCRSLQSKASTPAAARSEHWALSHHYTVLAEVKLLVDLPSKVTQTMPKCSSNNLRHLCCVVKCSMVKTCGYLEMKDLQKKWGHVRLASQGSALWWKCIDRWKVTENGSRCFLYSGVEQVTHVHNTTSLC